MHLKWCDTCKDYAWTPHACPPAWDWRFLYRSNQPSEWFGGEIRARDAEDAAEKAAKAYDAEDYPLSKGGNVEIEVRPAGGEDVTRWKATAELNPSYYVEAVTTENPTL